MYPPLWLVPFRAGTSGKKIVFDELSQANSDYRRYRLGYRYQLCFDTEQ